MSMQVNALSSHPTNIVPDVSIAIDFREWLGGEHKIDKYSHELATVGGKQIVLVPAFWIPKATRH